MISQTFTFKCINCGYEEDRVIGDVRPDINELRHCPKCNGKMKKTYKKGKDSFLDRLGKIFK